VSGTTPQSGTVTDDSNLVTIPATQSPAVTISKSTTSTGFSAVGQQVAYTITALNSGNVTLVNVIISDPNATVGACTPAAPVTLAPGQSMSCSAVHTVTQADLDAGRISNTARVTAASGAVNITGNSNEVVVPGAPPPVIPRTGGDVSETMSLVASLLIAGLLLLLVSKRRRQYYLVLPPL
jgi:LPXTG-motif cell wall-anchored protein